MVDTCTGMHKAKGINELGQCVTRLSLELSRDKSDVVANYMYTFHTSIQVHACKSCYSAKELSYSSKDRCNHTINSTYSADASVLVQMSTEAAKTTCMHCYNFQKHLQTPCSCR